MSEKLSEIEKQTLAIEKAESERKKAEEALRDSDERFRRMLDSIQSVPVQGYGPDGTTQYWNQASERLYGYSAEEAIGRNLLNLIIPLEMREEVSRAIAQMAETGTPIPASELSLMRKDGSRVAVFSSHVVVRIQGRPPELFCVDIDISERKQMAAALAASENKFRKLVETISDVFFETNDQGNITYISPAGLKMWGSGPSEIVGKNLIELVHPEDKNRIIKRYSELKQGGKERPETYRFFNQTGCVCWVRSHTAPINENGRFKGVRGILSDFTAQNQAEEERIALEKQLMQAQKIESIGTLAGGIAHDFNNILFPLLGFAELLKEDLPTDSPLQDHIDEILRAALRSKALVKQILAFSRKGEHCTKPIHLTHIVKEALKLLRSTIPATIEIQQDIDADCGVILADATQVHQIVMNLGTNAYHAMEVTGGKLKISVKQVDVTRESVPSGLHALAPGKYALLTVSDTGVGIEKENLSKIIDPYFTTKGVGKGTGLGLSVVQGIVRTHKGDILIESAPKMGTEVFVYLPILERIAENNGGMDSEPIHGGTEKILLVDDDEAIVRLEQKILARWGYSVEKHTSCIEALKAFRAKPNDFDLVITDMTMPHMTGDKLAKKLRLITPGIPIIICTGFSEKIDEKKAKTIGVNGCLMKPVVKSAMAKMVRKVLDETKGYNPDYRLT